MNKLNRLLLPSFLALLISGAARSRSADALTEVSAAIGFDRLAAHPNGITIAAQVHSLGVDGTSTLTFRDARHILEHVDDATPRTNGINGDAVWSTDIGGETRPAGPADRESVEVASAIRTGTFLSADSGFTFSPQPLSATSPADKDIVLSFTHAPGVIKGELHIDPTTRLPKLWTYSAGARVVRIALSDYRDFDGFKYAATVNTVTDASEDMTDTNARAADAPTTTSYAMPPAKFSDATFNPNAKPELEVIKAPTGHLLVHPLVNGKDVGWFIFDSGAGTCVLSTPVLAELGIKPFGQVPARGVGGTSQASFSRPNTLTVGPLTIAKPLMVNIDLSFLTQYMGRKIAGLVGYNVLARSVVTLDLNIPATSLHDPATFASPALAWESLVIDQRLPHANATFEDRPALFRLDTGDNGSLSMHYDAVNKYHLLDNRQTTPAAAGGVGGQVKMKSGKLSTFVLGRHAYTDLPTLFATEPKGVFADPYTAGNIGGKVMRQFTLTFDYPHDRIAFTERPTTRP